jgi:hypothetical protein
VNSNSTSQKDQAKPTARPIARPPALSFEDYKQAYANRLLEDFALQPPEGCVVLVEGTTDIEYLQVAAGQFRAAHGVDLLDASPLYGDGARIAIVTPGTPKHPNPLLRHTGGTKRLDSLIQHLASYSSVFENTARLCVVADHDDAGRGLRKKLKDSGFADDYMLLTHEPSEHPTACSNTDVVVEDLLSLSVQDKFFENGNASCRVTYSNGVRTRYQWDMPSKEQLPSFVREHATLSDVQELVRVLCRVRSLWSLPCPELGFPHSSS